MQDTENQFITVTKNKELDEFYMQRCLWLAHHAASHVAPNPMVGAVVVHQGLIVGEGYHHKYGQPHAEPIAIKSVKSPELLKESTLYVNLEPCSHFGKTPPCADFIIQSGIRKVVIGTYDPNEKVAGRGVKRLIDAGIEAKVGVLEAESRELNKRFFMFHKNKRPYIILKWAQTQDGFIDKMRQNPEELPLQISNPLTRLLTHKMRSENQSIMVSTNTVLLDNPSLTVRNWTGKNPIRIVLDRQGLIPQEYNLLDGKVQTYVFSNSVKRSLANLEYIQENFGEGSLESIVKKIYELNINSILVEGGAKLLNSFIEKNLWDEANVEISNQIVYEGVLAPLLKANASSFEKYNGHLWIGYKNNNRL